MPFVKGQSGNPNGPGKGYKQKKTLDREAKKAELERRSSEEWDMIIDKLIGLAKKEDIKAIKYLIDQNIGEPTKSLQVSDVTWVK